MAKRPTAKKKLRMAFIGAGGIAGTHMRYLAEMDDVALVALADISEDAMAGRAEEFGIDAAFTDYRKMLREVKPDAVSVCTPNGMHARASIAASTAGADVLVEKPMAMNAREAQGMIDAAKKSHRKLVIGFQHRYDPRTQFVRNAVEAGQLGKVVYARVQALRRRGIPNWGVFGRKDLQGGGGLIDIGVHALEMTHYAMGSPRPVAASGIISIHWAVKRIKHKSARAAVIPDKRPRPPELILIMDWPIMAHPPIAPKKPHVKLARP